MIAIVEDEWDSFDNLKKCLETYGKEYKTDFSITRFKNGLDFIEEYRPEYDMVFMDIDMPHMNGLTVAKELRKIDPNVVLIFVTFLVKYALRGYEVEALDYLIKPVNYNVLKITMERALWRCSKKKDTEIVLRTVEGEIAIELSSLNYVEINNHSIIYHTARGEYHAYDTMRTVEKLLPADQFSKCNRSMLVNLRSVTRINGNLVYIGDTELEISRPRKQAFMDAFHAYKMPKHHR